MRIFTGRQGLPPDMRDAIGVIGNFDGLHNGHQALLAKARRLADRQGRPLGVVTFAPHPRTFFNPNGETFRLACRAQKHRLLREAGVDYVLELPFDRETSHLSPPEFVTRVLYDQCGLAVCCVGSDFKFGHLRAGDIHILRECGQDMGIDVVTLDLLGAGGDVVNYSSSGVRTALKTADFNAASSILGWDWHIEGPVVKGDQRGRELGYPTANQNIGNYICPPYGVYAVKVSFDTENAQPRYWRPAVANLGIRPMFTVAAPLLETFIFDFDQDIYGQTLRVAPVAFIRGEEKFDDLKALITRMDQDTINAKEILTQAGL